MKPFTLAVWITKFIASLVLLLAVVPAGLYFGATYAVHRYEQRQAAKQQAAEARNKHAYYCSVDGYGVPAGELDDPHGSNHIDAPDCKVDPYSKYFKK
jgi:hypothetical protein